MFAHGVETTLRAFLVGVAGGEAEIVDKTRPPCGDCGVAQDTSKVNRVKKKRNMPHWLDVCLGRAVTPSECGRAALFFNTGRTVHGKNKVATQRYVGTRGTCSGHGLASRRARALKTCASAQGNTCVRGNAGKISEASEPPQAKTVKPRRCWNRRRR